MNNKECSSFKFNLLILGHSNSGNKELLKLLADQLASDYNIGTVKIKIDCYDIKFNIVASDGVERFRCLTYSYIKNYDAIIFLYNVTDESSYNGITNFYSQAKEYKKSLPIMLIGNFAEDSKHRVVPRLQAKKLAEDNGDLYFELLNSNDRNISVYLEELTRRILETKEGIIVVKPKITNNEYSIILNKTKEQKQKKNCI